MAKKKSAASAGGKAKKAVKSEKKAAKSAKKLAPKMVKLGKGPTPFDIGMAVVKGFNAGTPEAELWKAHWSKKACSIEGHGVNMMWDGLKAIAAKNEEWMRTHKIHGAKAEGPFVGATGFAIRFNMDVEDTNTGKRENMSEVGVYTIKGGKIVQEEFMYGMG